MGSIKSIKFTISEDELQEHSVRNHSNNKEGEGEGSWCRLDNPKDDQSKTLEHGEEDHPPGLDLLDIRDIGVVFDWHEAKCQTVKELDSVHSRNTHVQEDSKEDSKRNQLENWCQKNGTSNHDGHQSCCESLISDSNHLWRLS